MAEPRQNLIGSSDTLLQTLDQVSRLATLNRPVLVIGERGTGKEMIAQRLHFLSARWDQPYLQVNCAALNENLLDSELFGHEAGAFTGANRARTGLFERADGGTLFLDELAAASLPVQEKLLRVIEYGCFQRLGGNSVLEVEVRVVAATNADLPSLVRAEKFRADLLDRLAFDVVVLPPLRERDSDVLELAEHFGLRMSLELGYQWFPGFTRQARQQLLHYDWPGNVRELKNVVERSIYRNLQPEQPISEIVLDPFATPWLQSPSAYEFKEDREEVNSPADTVQESFDLREYMNRIEQEQILRALQSHGFQQKRTAKALGLTYHQLRAALRKYPQLLVNR